MAQQAQSFDMFSEDVPMGMEDDMMSYMNFDETKDYSSYLFPPGEQEAVINGTSTAHSHVHTDATPATTTPTTTTTTTTTNNNNDFDTTTRMGEISFGKRYMPNERLIVEERLENLEHNGEGLKYNLQVTDLPYKSRVETQIKCKVTISPPPFENLLKLPADTIAQPKLMLETPLEPASDVLYLQTDVVSLTNPNQPVHICSRCLNREKKRAFRKKKMDANEELHWNQDRPRRLVIFSCKEVQVLSPLKPASQFSQAVKELELPLRLACYCRHHSAKQGFQIVFTLRDWQDNIVGKATTRAIFITDDHKEAVRTREFPSPGSMEESSEAVSDQSSTYSLKRRRGEDYSTSRVPYPSSSMTRVSSSKSMNREQLMPSPQSSDVAMQPLTPMHHHHSPQHSTPQIQRIIPAQGSVRGGVEVTLLGVGFNAGLNAVFGDARSTLTQCWSDSTIVTHLPPCSTPGPVVVSFEGVVMSNPQIFTYIDDTDRQLIELALQVVGMKMNGKLEDARNIAMRIVQQDDETTKMERSTSNSPNDRELVILRCIELVKVSQGKIPNWQLQNSEGQTMMHLAAGLGYFKVVMELVSQGARIELNDTNGMTPMHFAALHGRRSVIELLAHHGADPFNMTNNGSTAMDLAQSNLQDVLPLAMSRQEYTQYWIARRNSSSSTLDSIHEPFVPYEIEQPEFDLWSESDEDSGYENDSEDDEGMDNDEVVARPVAPKTLTTAQNISNYFSQLSNTARDRWDRRWDDVLNYIYNRPPSPTQHSSSSSSSQEARREVRRGSEDGSDSDTTVAPTNIQRMWKYFMHEESKLPSYDEIFPPGQAQSSSQASAQQDQQPPQQHKVQEETNQEQEYIEQWTNARKQLRNDRMLFFFWLPALIIMTMVLALKYTGYFAWIETARKAKLDQLGNSVREVLSYYIVGERNSNSLTTALVEVPPPITN